MNQDIEGHLRYVESQLSLPPERARAVLAELREHLRADFSERMAAGSDEVEAARRAVAEMGDPDSMAQQFNHVHEPGGSILRSILAVQIAVMGFFGVFVGSDRASLDKVAQLASTLGHGLLGWSELSRSLLDNSYGAYRAASAWLWDHGLHGLADATLAMPAFAAVGLLAGYVARRRGWVYGLIPWGMVFGTCWLSMALRRQIRFDVANDLVVPAMVALALAGGGHVGSRFRPSARWPRVAVLFVSGAIVGGVSAVGFAADFDNIYTIVGLLVAYGWILGLTVWMLLTGARYYRSRKLPGHAG